MISEYLGFDSDYIILGLAAFCVILFILTVVNMAKTSKLRKKYEAFMMGKDAKSLEETLVTRLSQVDKLISANEANEKNIRKMFDNMKFTFQKVGLVKYDAFNEMGGKLSFSLAMLNESDNGFVLNAVHSREGLLYLHKRDYRRKFNYYISRRRAGSFKDGKRIYRQQSCKITGV